MKSVIAFGLGLAAVGLSALAATGAQAADPAASYRMRKERAYYERPVPRVYFAPVRPAAVCRVAAVNTEKDWPREQGRTMRCTDFY